VSNNKTPAVEVSGLSKSFGSVVALQGIDLRVGAGQYFVLLGPSGGGKTTLLRLIGGFIRATQGRVLLHGVDVSNQPPDKRPTSMVFQSYALFPHMTVSQNVGYGLRLKKLVASEITEKVDAMLADSPVLVTGDRTSYPGGSSSACSWHARLCLNAIFCCWTNLSRLSMLTCARICVSN